MRSALDGSLHIALDEQVTVQREAINALHEACGIFTKRQVAQRVLDLVLWDENLDCQNVRLLEPGCGNGTFVAEAARRLARAARRNGLPVSYDNLRNSIVALELWEPAVHEARYATALALREEGIDGRTARRLADRWICHGDFVLSNLGASFTHVIGNPPYVRWSKIPKPLRTLYERNLDRWIARGDLTLPFIWLGIQALRDDGRLAYLVSDRWLRTVYAEEVRNRLSDIASVEAHIEMHNFDAFERHVDAYPAITVLRKSISNGTPTKFLRVSNLLQLDRAARRLRTRRQLGRHGHKPLSYPGAAVIGPREAVDIVRELSTRLPSLTQVGCKIRCGIATGLAEAFIVSRTQTAVERSRLLPYIGSADLRPSGEIITSRFLINPWTVTGQLVDLDRYPRLAAHLRRFQEKLKTRACVTTHEEWFRTIDRITPAHQSTPKLVIAGMGQAARVCLDQTGLVPGNALYMITSESWPLNALLRLFRAGAIDLFAETLACRFSGNTKRYHGYLLRQIRLPYWSDLDEQTKHMLCKQPVNLDRCEILGAVYGVAARSMRVILGRLPLWPVL